MSHTAANPACVPSSEARSLSVHPEAHVASAEGLSLISLSARLLFENGQSTEKLVSALDQLAAAIGFRAIVFPRWGELTVLITDGSGSRNEILAAAPAGVDMRKVAATIGVIDDVCDGRLIPRRYELPQEVGELLGRVRLPTGGVDRYVLALRLYDTPVGLATRSGRDVPMPTITQRGCA